ncbi:hypothetical protein ACHAXA_006025 [Cyclostephanos tholiformis]|uniref:Uncharacterized protein n=1 Tax=Cyclostephanos tholiformis TaxID=382380 RepID=A0ABD3SRE5_9STRA
MNSSSENRNKADRVDSMEVEKSGNIDLNAKTGHTKSTELVVDQGKKSLSSFFRRMSSSSVTDSASHASHGYPSSPLQDSGVFIKDAADESIVTPIANPSHDVRALAQLYHSSRRSRNSVFVSPNSDHQQLSMSLISSSSSSENQKIWDKMQDAIDSIEIDDWAFPLRPPFCKSSSTNSLSSIESKDAMALESATAGELFDEDFFERH